MRKGMSQALDGRYELKDRLSRGGMGEVFVAETVGAQGFRKPVVIKRIIPAERDNPQHRRAFVREAKLLARLPHPNIVQVIELVEDGEELFLVMELVHGLDLAKLVDKLRENGQDLSDPMVALIAFDMLEALEFAHATSGDGVEGVVHSDVSPQNVLVSTSGQAKLCDFGIARVGSSEGGTMAGRGKLMYAPPEQLYRQKLDGRSDLYALAAVLYECAIGESVFTGPTPKDIADQISAGDVQPMLARAPRRDRRLCSAIDRAMRVDPLERFQTAALFRAAIEPVLEEAGPLATRALLRDTVRSFVPGGTGMLPESSGEVTQHWVRIAERGGGPRRDRPLVQNQARRWLVPTAAVAMIALLGIAVWLAALLEKPPMITPAVVKPEPATAKPNAAMPSTAASPDPVEPSATEALRPPEPLSPPEARHGRTKREPKMADMPAEADGYLTLNAVPWAYVTIDDRRLDGVTPLIDVRLEPGKHRLIVQSSDGRSQTLEVNVRSGDHLTRIVRF